MKSAGNSSQRKLRFTTRLERSDDVGSATFLLVPPDVMAAFAPRKRVPVAVSIGSQTWRSTIATYGGRHLVPVRSEIRCALGANAGDTVVVELSADDAPRTAPVPGDLVEALAAAGIAQRFAEFPFSHQMEYVRWIEEAKRAETRRSRIEKTVASTKEKRPLR